MRIKNVKFKTSVFDKKNIINDDKKQIVLVGKSNVGKSSFINAICNNNKLAKVGQNPGKTRSINYYDVDDSFYMVDLPGYGFSKMSNKEKQNIANMVEYYLLNYNISHIFFLLDIRHTPTEDDRQMYDFLVSCNMPFTIIANKSDKISKTAADKNIANIRKFLFAKEDIIPFSSEKKLNVDTIKDLFNNIIL